jgi:hypothetical protein
VILALDDPAVLLTAPASVRVPLGAHTRDGLLGLASLDSCHTLVISKAKPDTLVPYHSLYVRTDDNLVTYDSFRISHFASSICTNMVVSSVSSFNDMSNYIQVISISLNEVFKFVSLHLNAVFKFVSLWL